MAYSLETSSVKTIVPGAEVSGFCDVVARQKISEVSGKVPQLSAGEGIDISTVDGKTVITNNISAGSNISLVYDMETNTYRIDAKGGDLTNYYQKTETSSKTELNTKFNDIYNKTDTSSKQEISAALQYVSSNAGHTYTGVAPIQVNNTTDQISITGESLSAGPGIDIFSSGGYIVISSYGGYSSQITCSSVKLTTANDTNTFVTSALPNLNKMTFIAPTYGPYETYSALIDDGVTTFVAEVDSGCCRTVVRCWEDSRHKYTWGGLNQETYFYIG